MDRGIGHSLKEIISAIFIVSSMTSCSHGLSQKRNQAILVAAAAGLVVGGVTAPNNERKELHSLYWAGIAGTTTALLANHHYSDEKQAEILQLENSKLKSDLQLFENTKGVLIDEGHGQFQKQNQSGKWRLYKVDRWEKIDETSLRHVDQILEVKNPDKK